MPDFPDPSSPHVPRDLYGEAPGPMEDGRAGAEIQGDENLLPIPAAGSFFVWLCVFFYFNFFFFN